MHTTLQVIDIIILLQKEANIQPGKVNSAVKRKMVKDASSVRDLFVFLNTEQVFMRSLLVRFRGCTAL